MTATVGWDIGGAHLKAALAEGGELTALFQISTPLWQGVDRLVGALEEILEQLPSPRCHAVTMTGELCDRFPSRREGVAEILSLFQTKVAPDPVVVFRLPGRLVPLERLSLQQAWPVIASANWLVSGWYLAGRLEEALFVDLGSTTTDLLPIREGRPSFRGSDDLSRLASGELLYLGVSRTPLATLADRVPFGGEWVPVMNELFATTADLFRITRELAAHLDQDPTADGGPKDRPASARRLARMVGRDLEMATLEAWELLARFWRERLLQKLTEGCFRLVTGGISGKAPLVGAGSGRFLLPEVARRLGRPYLDANELFRWRGEGELTPADLMPACALALLASEWNRVGMNRSQESGEPP